MQSHYSILSAAIRPEIQEQVAIGLLLAGSDSVYFRFSKNKIEVVKELLSRQAIKFLKDTLNQISKAASIENEKFKGLFGPSEILNRSFSAGYLEYLSKYSNNLILFSAPKTIELQANESLFEMIYKKYVDESAISEKLVTRRNFELEKDILFNNVKSYFNIEQEVTGDSIPGLLNPVRVDLIGKNEIPVFAQTIDLERQYYHINNDLAVLFMLNRALDNAKGFHISSEPDKTRFPGQHETWKNLRRLPESEYVDLSEVQKIEEYAIKHEVVPLMQVHFSE